MPEFQRTQRMSQKKKKSRKKRIFMWIIVPLLIVALAGAGYATFLLKKAESVVSKSYKPVKTVSKRTETVNPDMDNISILLIGVDESKKRKKQYGSAVRSDALLVATLNKKDKSVKLLSIPRDSYVYIPEKDKYDKITHAHAYGGPKYTIDTVQELLDIPIDYYVKVEMEGFSNIIDSLGGVTVDNAFAFDYEGYQFPKGISHIDGQKALAYVRMRYDDPEGDFGRNKRQQQVIRDLMDKAKGISTVNKLDNLLSVVGTSFKTNLTFENMKELMRDYKSSLEQIETIRVNGEGGKISGVYYYLVSNEERLRIKKQVEEFKKSVTSEAVVASDK